MPDFESEPFSVAGHFEEVRAFLDEVYAANPLLQWESGRMNSWRSGVHGEKEDDDPFFAANARVWRATGRVVGLCVSEYGENDFFAVPALGRDDVARDMVRWLEGDWGRGKDEIETDAAEDDPGAAAMLLENGFALKGHAENVWYYDLAGTDRDYRLEEGFSIGAFLDDPDYENRVAVARSAFGNESYGRENLERIQASPDYVRDLDLCVRAPDGRIAAYCMGWKETSDGTSGYVEPVGTHADFRRRGLAKAALVECFRRMKALGVERAVIASEAEPNVSNHLYQSLRPEAKVRVMKYSKPLGRGARRHPPAC